MITLKLARYTPQEVLELYAITLAILYQLYDTPTVPQRIITDFENMRDYLCNEIENDFPHIRNNKKPL